MTDGKTVQLGFRVRPEKAKLLEKLAESTERSKSWLLEQALESFLETHAWQVAHIEKGLADVDAGEVHPHAHIRDWLLTWGSETESEPPE